MTVQSNVHHCLECSYDLTSLFQTDEWGISHKLVARCPDCNTRHKLTTEGYKKETLVIIPERNAGKKMPLGDIIDVFIVRQATVREMEDRDLKLNSKHLTRCMRCQVIVSIFLSYLVRLQTEVFPKKDELIETFSPAGNPVQEHKITKFPPVKEKGRICAGCYSNYPPGMHANGSIEVLPDPMNMMRDGVRNVKESFTPKYERPITNYDGRDSLEVFNASPGIYDDDVVLGFNHGNEKTTEEVLKFQSSQATVYLQDIIKVRKNYPLRPSKINVRLHPSRNVKKIHIPEYPLVKFATNKERRHAFKRWFEKS